MRGPTRALSRYESGPELPRSEFSAFLEGRISESAIRALLLRRCREQPDVVWDLLALIDQYQRQGKDGSGKLRKLKDVLAEEGCSRPPVAERRDPVPASGASDTSEFTDLPAMGGQEAVAPLGVPTARTGSPADPRVPMQESRGFPRIGTVLKGRFVLEEVVGSGGMGIVYRARDRNRNSFPDADQFVAIKMLREELCARPDVVEHLRSEYVQTQRLSHPCIVNVYDFDSDAGAEYISMELLHGELASQLLARIAPDRLTEAAAMQLLGFIGDAVAHAHRRGVVHADLKPGNIMITDSGEVRILDFGLCRPMGREPWISELTSPYRGATRAYASIERLVGETPEVRDDIYSFACTAYEILSGRHPFDRKPADQACREKLVPRRIDGLSRAQWRIIKRGLAWRRDDRPANMAEVMTALFPHGPDKSLPIDLSKTRPSSTAPSWILRGAALGVLTGGLALGFGALRPLVDLGGVDGLQQVVGRVVDEAREMSPGTDTALRQRASDDGAATDTIGERQHADPETDTAGPTEAEPAASSESSTTVPLAAVEPVSPPTTTHAGPARIEFLGESVTVRESSAIARLPVVRRGAADHAASFKWLASSVTARGDLDFAALGTVTETFQPGERELMLAVPIVRDSIEEGLETFRVSIFDPSGASLGRIAFVTVVVED